MQLALIGLLAGCSSAPPLATVEQLDIDRYMGDWYVIGHIPPFLTKNAYNGLERYQRGDGARVNVEYTYNKGAFDGPAKSFSPVAFTDAGTLPSEWGIRLIWPLQSDFRITYVDADYEFTIVARNRRDYVWIMAREPIIDDGRYLDLVQRVAAMGYDTASLRKMPQQARSQRSQR